MALGKTAALLFMIVPANVQVLGNKSYLKIAKFCNKLNVLEKTENCALAREYSWDLSNVSCETSFQLTLVLFSVVTLYIV